MSSETPKTDFEAYQEGEGANFMVVDAEFARKLEKENNQLLAKNTALMAEVKQLEHTIVAFSKEIGDLQNDKEVIDYLCRLHGCSREMVIHWCEFQSRVLEKNKGKN